MDFINKLLFGKKYGVCIFCGRKTNLTDTVFNKDRACICRHCNSFIDVAPFSHLYPGTKHISFVVSPLYYSGLVKGAIHNLKFSSMGAVADCLCYYINTYLSVFEDSDESLLNDFDILIPVPLSQRRKNERGYNQADLLCRNIGEHFNIPTDFNALIKNVDTKPQSTLSRDKRKSNVENVYSCIKDMTGKNILLVDDVFTTGYTLDFCAKELKNQGAKIVAAITVTYGTAKRHSDIYYDLFS